MSRSELLKKMIDEENGYLVTSKAVAEGFTKPFISRYIKEHQMEKAAHGIYIMEDVWPEKLCTIWGFVSYYQVVAIR